MTDDEKIIKLTEITAGTNIDAGQLATLLALMGKLDFDDVTKVIWAAIGTANALTIRREEYSFSE
ncbi:MAG: hypothetical protein K2G36_08815 [Ruminococcus sp.]|nr:hypothetical protein [Ruminococcus sp.]